MAAEQPVVLLLDDAPDFVERVQCAGSAQQIQFRPVSGLEELRNLLRAGTGDCVVLAMSPAASLPGDALAAVTALAPWLPVIALLPEQQRARIAETLLLGAYDALAQPFEINELAARLDRALEYRFVARERDRLKYEVQRSYGAAGLTAASPAMRCVISNARLASENALPVLIRGEPGSGRERVARAIHFGSPQGAQSFLSICCSAFSGRDLDIELFGMRRNGLPPGFGFRTGLIEAARGGTLYLEGVDRLPRDLQTKLAAALVKNTFKRAGDDAPVPVHVRIIASALPDSALQGSGTPFAPEFAALLSRQIVAVPPLRHRQEDIAPLAQYFVQTKGHLAEHPAVRLSPEAVKLLESYSWPGNVRELEEVIDLALRVARQPVIDALDLPLPGQPVEFGPYADAKQKLINKFEIDYMTSLLRTVNGNVSRAAEIAQKDRSDLYSLIRKHRIDVDQFR